VSFFSDLSHETVTSVLPFFVISVGGSPASLGAIEGASDALAAFAKLAGGRVADRVRRLKPLVLIGYALTTLAVPAIAAARSPLAVALLRAVGWLGRGFRSPLRDTLLVRAAPRDATGRAFGLERALDQLGAVLAPMAVLLLIAASVHLRTIIALALAPGLVALGLLLAFVREHDRPVAPDPGGGGAKPGHPMRRFLTAVAVFGCGDFAKTLLVLWALGPEGGRATPSVLGTGVVLYAWFNGITVCSAYVAGRASDSLGRKPVLALAYLAGSAGAVVPVALSPGWGAGALALGLSGLLVGAEESVERAWAGDLAGGRHGRAFGLLHSINGVADLVASAGVGLLWAWLGPEVAFGAASVLMAAGASLSLTVPNERRSGQRTAP
jgi:MFS family permease